jgi:hypothetical protein
VEILLLMNIVSKIYCKFRHRLHQTKIILSIRVSISKKQNKTPLWTWGLVRLWPIYNTYLVCFINNGTHVQLPVLELFIVNFEISRWKFKGSQQTVYSIVSPQKCDSLRNVGGSTQVPVRAWNNARKGTPPVKLERRQMTYTVSV